MEVGASAAASRRVWYPREEAYLIRDNGFFELDTFDWPVNAKSEGCSGLDFGRLFARIVYRQIKKPRKDQGSDVSELMDRRNLIESSTLASASSKPPREVDSMYEMLAPR